MSKVAIITGSAKRMGREIARGLAKQGYFCWIQYNRSVAEAHETVKIIESSGGQAKTIQGNQDNLENVSAMIHQIIQQSPKIDCLVNNVGIYQTGNLLQFDPQLFSQIIQTNLLGCYYWIQGITPYLQRSGNIFNLGFAGTSQLTTSERATAYTISKTGLHQLTLAYAKVLAKKKITVNTISPGQLENSVDLPEKIKAAIPLGRAGKLSEVVDLILYLVSPKGQYITGQNIEISGGYNMTHSSHLET